MKILIIEDNKILNDNIAKYLEINNIDSIQLFNGENILYELTKNNFDAIILDIWLPNKNWFEICNEIREKWIIIPILMLTARNETKNKIYWLNIWADDYLTKPFDYKELIARLKSIIRRNYQIKSNIIKIQDIKINIDTNEIQKWWKQIKLSKLEFNLLKYLINNKWKIISKEELLEKVWWEFDAFSMSRTVDVYIWYLRKKLEKDLISTKRGLGYIIK